MNLEKYRPPVAGTLVGEDSTGHMANRVFQQLDKCAGFPYSKREYLRRTLWEVVETTLIRWSPRRALGWRRFWLRRRVMQVQRTV